jgi:hypothetical protein
MRPGDDRRGLHGAAANNNPGIDRSNGEEVARGGSLMNARGERRAFASLKSSGSARLASVAAWRSGRWWRMMFDLESFAATRAAAIKLSGGNPFAAMS